MRIIILTIILILTTSYKESESKVKFEYESEWEGIRENLNQAQQDLNYASGIVNDEKKLKRLKRKYKD